MADGVPSRAATAAPLLLGALGPVGAGVGLLGALFQGNRRRQAEAARIGDVMQTDFAQLTDATEEQLINEAFQLEQAGLEVPTTLRNQIGRVRADAERQRTEAAALAASQDQARQQQFAAINVLRDDISKPVQSLAAGRRQLEVIQQAPSGFAGDAAVVNNYARLLNPGERLTQDDIDAVSSDERLSSQIAGIIRKAQTGQILSVRERQMLTQSAALLQMQNQREVETVIAPVLRTAEAFGVAVNQLVDPGVFTPEAELQALIDVTIAGAQPAGAAPPQPAAAPAPRPVPEGTRFTETGSIILGGE